MHALIDFARHIAVKELWVYTSSSDNIAINFYRSVSFEVLGTAADWMPGRTMDNSDIVLRRILS
jgi:ribosomal protein S18 acetylase RimI-like enzyme